MRTRLPLASTASHACWGEPEQLIRAPSSRQRTTGIRAGGDSWPFVPASNWLPARCPAARHHRDEHAQGVADQGRQPLRSRMATRSPSDMPLFNSGTTPPEKEPEAGAASGVSVKFPRPPSLPPPVPLNVNAYRESGAELVKGQGRFVGPRTIEVTADDGTRTLRGEVVVICTGSRARIDPIPGLAESRPMTHVEALELDRVPKHLLVLGGGYVGLEMAQALRRFGSRVTVIERNDALAHREDRDVSEALRELFDDEGIEVLTATPVARVEGRSGASVRLHATHGVIEGSDLLVASGRTPNTDGIGVETAGIERDDRGFIKVDERLRTTA